MMKKILLCLIVLFSFSLEAIKYNLAIAAISRDDEPYLKEWIEFHQLVGVEHFYIYCNGDWENYQQTLYDYIQSGIVDLISTDIYKAFGDRNDLTVFNRIQCQAYTDIANQVQDDVKWLAVIDTDEFLFSPKRKNILKMLAKYEKKSSIGGIGVNWVIFGTSNVPFIPDDKTMIELLTWRSLDQNLANKHVKTIVCPKKVNYYINPHYPIYHEGFIQVDTNGLSFEGPFSPSFKRNKLRINHYWVRDENYFWNYKVPRRASWEGPKTQEENQNMINELNLQQDDAILKFVPQLRQSLKLKSDF